MVFYKAMMNIFTVTFTRTTNLIACAIFAVGVAIPHPVADAADATKAAPEVSLADAYRPDDNTVDLAEYWVSEKYDGVRAVWDGQRLRSRSGNVFAAPHWFVADLPATALDGELWLGRGQFEATVSVVRKQQPHDGWREIRFMVFDLPAHAGTFRQRQAALRALVAASKNAFWQVVRQRPVASREALQALFDETVAGGGEGLMLRRIDSYHQSGRSRDLLKYKPFYDAEATVIGHRPGRGKYAGMTGSLRVRTPQGRVFRIGSGLSDAQRKDPPPVGATITYRYQGLTRNGLPRHPVYLRIRRPAP